MDYRDVYREYIGGYRGCIGSAYVVTSACAARVKKITGGARRLYSEFHFQELE